MADRARFDRGLTILVGFAIVGVATTSAKGQSLSQRNNVAGKIENTDTNFSAVGSLYRELFAGVDQVGLAELRSRHCDSIAIQAAWEEVQLLERRPKTTSNNIAVRPNMANWFVGFFEGRGRVGCPRWWRDYVVSSNSTSISNSIPGNGIVDAPETESIPKYQGIGLEPIEGPSDTRLRRRGKALDFSIGDETIQVPDDLFPTNKDGSIAKCCVSGKFTDLHVFIAVHTDTGDMHTVYCIERMSQRVRWKAKACGCWWGGTSGVQESRVTVTADANRVYVFGWAAIGVYAHAFHIDTGRTSFFFSSTF